MIDYHIDPDVSKEITNHLTNMNAVLREVTVTYQVLEELLREQDKALRGPALNNLRTDLLQKVTAAINPTKVIAVQVDKLAKSSGTLSSRIAAFEAETANSKV